MSLPTRHLVDLIRDLADVDRCRLVCQKAKPELPMLTSSTSEKSADIVDEGRVLRSALDLLDIWSIVTIKIDRSSAEDHRHASRACVASSTLAVVVASPGVNIS